MRDHYAPLSDVQRNRLLRAVELTSAAYAQWMMARAMELGDGFTAKKMHHFYSLRSAFEEMTAARGLRTGDRVRLFDGRREETEGYIIRHQVGAFFTMRWTRGTPPTGAKGAHPQAWQLEMVEPARDETKEKQ